MYYEWNYENGYEDEWKYEDDWEYDEWGYDDDWRKQVTGKRIMTTTPATTSTTTLTALSMSAIAPVTILGPSTGASRRIYEYIPY